MRLTNKEVEFFKNLHQTEVAGSLNSYFERLCSYICDSRNWKELGIEGAEVANSAESVIRKYVIDRLKLQTKSKETQDYEWE